MDHIGRHNVRFFEGQFNTINNKLKMNLSYLQNPFVSFNQTDEWRYKNDDNNPTTWKDHLEEKEP